MSDCIKPLTKVFVFGSLEETAEDGVRTPRLDRCIPYRSSLSYKTRLVARLAEFCRVYSDICPKFSGKQEHRSYICLRKSKIIAMIISWEDFT